jgi:hypothetical protein
MFQCSISAVQIHSWQRGSHIPELYQKVILSCIHSEELYINRWRVFSKTHSNSQTIVSASNRRICLRCRSESCRSDILAASQTLPIQEEAAEGTRQKKKGRPDFGLFYVRTMVEIHLHILIAEDYKGAARQLHFAIQLLLHYKVNAHT